jgi:hypothetical protein
MFDLQNCKFQRVLEPVSVAGGGTATVQDIDTRGFRAAALLVQAGAVGANGVSVIKWQESDVAGSGFVDIPGAAHAALVDASDNAIVCTFLNLLGRKRHLRAVITNGATNPSLLAAVAILYRAESTPKSAAERGLAEQLFV